MVRKIAAEQLHLFTLGSSAADVCEVQSLENDFEPSTKQVMDMIEMLRASNRLQELEMVDDYTAGVADDFDSDAAYDRVCDLLMETEWDNGDAADANVAADDLHDLMHVKRGNGLTFSVKAKVKQKEEADFTYASLIHESEMGY